MLNKRINLIGKKNTDEKHILIKKSEQIDKEIDKLVYKLYGINKKEKKIIEESLNY